MKKVYFIIFAGLCSCAHYPHSDDDIVGRYNSLSFRKENYYFQFYADNTYQEILIYNEDTLFDITGKWKLLDENGTLSISNFKAFNSDRKIVTYSNGGTVLVSNNILVFGGDDYTENFKKIR